MDFAAIGSLEAAKYYGLNIIKDSIQNTENNTTRFLIISTKKIVTKDANKISFIARTSHEPKSLYKILKKILKNNRQQKKAMNCERIIKSSLVKERKLLIKTHLNSIQK
ncbi:MAG: hypothetical protein COB73_04550 [Flavobacteriaceae bacterium]|nr:MAG: hypothetical protein COB73_04550 [Flavobacteriaceae bacterium]